MARRPKDEGGFILITAIWLLILCGSIAAVLTLRAVTERRGADAAERALADTLTLDAALETLLADILFRGPASPWSRLPPEAATTIGEQSVKVRITSELGRIDVNEADPQLVGRALEGLGLAAPDRDTIVGTIVLRRSAKRPISSWDELRPILAATGSGNAPPCFEAYLTLFSGLAAPQASSMPPALASLLGGPAPAITPIAAGTPVRIELSLPSGAALAAWVRLTGLLQQPYSIAGFQRRAVCG